MATAPPQLEPTTDWGLCSSKSVWAMRTAWASANHPIRPCTRRTTSAAAHPACPRPLPGNLHQPITDHHRDPRTRSSGPGTDGGDPVTSAARDRNEARGVGAASMPGGRTQDRAGAWAPRLLSTVRVLRLACGAAVVAIRRRRGVDGDGVGAGGDGGRGGKRRVAGAVCRVPLLSFQDMSDDRPLSCRL